MSGANPDPVLSLRKGEVSKSRYYAEHWEDSLRLFRLSPFAQRGED